MVRKLAIGSRYCAEDSRLVMLPKIDSYQRSTYLIRLRRLVAVRLSSKWPEYSEWGQRMIDNCIEATALDCLDVGAAGQAARIMEKLPRKH